MKDLYELSKAVIDALNSKGASLGSASQLLIFGVLEKELGGKVTLVGVKHSGEICVEPEVYANWDLGQKRITQLSKEWDKEVGFDVYAKEVSVQTFVKEKSQ